MSNELEFNCPLTDEEIHEAFKDYDYEAALQRSLQEMKEDVLRSRAQRKKLQTDEAQPVASANDIGYSSFQDPRLQPPEYDEPEEESTEELVQFSFDELVDVDPDGSWDYEDRSYKFARNPDSYDGDWYTGDFNVYFRDVTGVVEDMDSVLEKNMPMQAGRYRITGDANLYYNVSGIQVYTDYYGLDDYDQTIVQDGIDVEFNYGKSHIDNLVVQKLD